MTEYRLGLKNPKEINLTELIISGKKTIEGRKSNDKTKNIKKNDTIIFKTKNKNIECKVTNVVNYDSFEDFIKNVELKKHMPGVSSKEEAKKIYKNFNKNDKNKKNNEIKGEFIAFHIKFIRQIFYRKIQEPWFSHLEKNKKVEGRLNRGSFSQMNKDDIIYFVSNKKLIKTKITKIEKFKSFKNMLEKYLKQSLPGIETVEKGVEIYRQFYPDEKIEKEVGVLALHIDTINNKNKN